MLVIPDPILNSHMTSEPAHECSGPHIYHLRNGHRGAFVVVFHG